MSDQAENFKQDSGLLNNAVNLFSSPGKAWEAIKSEGGAWFPVVVIIAMVGLVNFLYFQSVNMDWFIQQQVAIAGADSTPAEKEAMTSQMASMGRGMFTAFAIGGSAIGIPLMYAIVAVLFIIISNIRNDNLTYGDCFSLVSWAGLVKVVSVLVALFIVSMDSSGELGQHHVTGLNLNLLFFQVEAGHPWYNWLTNFDLVSLWSAVLLGLGYHKFTNAPVTTSMIFGFLPTILYFGILALLV